MLRSESAIAPLLLHGRAVWPDTTSSVGYILIEGGHITYAGADGPAEAPADAVRIELAEDQFVFPGLLDLHNHIDYNVLPLWQTRPEWDCRFEWRADDDYHRCIHDVLDQIAKKWIPMPGKPDLRITYQLLSEMQALAGGTTTLQEDQFLDRERTVRMHMLLRSTGVPEDLDLPSGVLLDSVIDFYQPDPPLAGVPHQDTSDHTPMGTEQLREFLTSISSIRATLAHLAEGRAGFLPGRLSADAYSRKEVAFFLNEMRASGIDPATARSAHISLIHACGMDLRDPATLQTMKDYGISVVWSPVSNLLLYDDTNPIPLLPHGAFLTALGSDWSPSGSKHVWEEAKFALFFARLLLPPIDHLEHRIFSMVTSAAAQCLGREGVVGEIVAGAVGDLFILRSPGASRDPMDVFFGADDSHVTGTIVGGFPVYGDEDFVRQFERPYQPMPDEEQPAGCTKVWCFPDEVHVNLNSEIAEIDRLLDEMGVQRSRLLVVRDEPYRDRIEALKNHLRETVDRPSLELRVGAVREALGRLT